MTKKTDWPKVVQVEGGWRLDSLRGLAKRRRVTVSSKAEADKLAADWRAERDTAGSDLFLTTKQRADALTALKLFEAKQVTGHSLTDAVTYFLARKFPHGGDITCSTAVTLFVSEKEAETITKDGVEVPRFSAPYLSSLHRFERFGDAFADTKLSHLTGKQVMMWFKERGLNDVSQRKYYDYFRMFFNWCKHRGYLHTDPLQDVNAPHVVQKDPTILTIEQCANLLKSAWDSFDGHLFPYVVLNLFCGIRPKELTRLRWSHMKNDAIRLDASITKTNDVRNVPIPTNALLMLDYWRERSKVDIYASTELINGDWSNDKLRREFKRVYRRAGLKAWPKDAGRHTFASYYLSAVEGNVGKLQARLGHATHKMSLRHYINLNVSHWTEYFTLFEPATSASLLTSKLDTCKLDTFAGPHPYEPNQAREILGLTQV